MSEIEKLAREVERLQAKIQGTYCAYCGKEYPLDDEAASNVSEHIRTCEKHPMREMEKECERLRTEVARLRARHQLEKGEGW